jgi:hypothetical protein
MMTVSYGDPDYMLTTGRVIKLPFTKSSQNKKNVSLSRYFPAGTTYFYGYPAGEDSGFLNKVPPVIEELVAARAFSCAGDKVSVVCFAATTAPQLDSDLLEKFAVPRLNKNQLALLPPQIDEKVVGAERNKQIKDALSGMLPEHSLIMAHPFSGAGIEPLYQIPIDITHKLNDKSKMNEYIADEHLPKRLAIYENGAEFAASYSQFKPPYVVKASSSSSGDGVYICLTEQDALTAVKDLKQLQATVLIEEFIEVYKNYVINFGISSIRKQPIDIIGVHEQLTTPEGGFLGGIIRSSEFPKELLEAKKYLHDEVLPKIRDMGWYGIGAFDTLVDKSGKFYFIDCNFRINSTSAYHLLVANGTIPAPLISFGAEFRGSQADLEKCLLPLAGKDSPGRIMQLIALNYHDGVWGINAAMFFKTEEQLHERIHILLDKGLVSGALSQIVK